MPDANNLSALPAVPLHGFLFDTSGNCWVGAGNGTLCKLDEQTNSFEQVVIDDRTAAADDGIRSMYRDKDSRFWIGTTYPRNHRP